MQNLSKGGSGDVLSGLIGSLLAQGYKTLDAAITASLAHNLAGRNIKKQLFPLIPSDLIEEVKNYESNNSKTTCSSEEKKKK